MHPSASERVGPFALRQQLGETAGLQVWLADRVAGERRPLQALVRRPSDPTDVDATRAIHREYELLRRLDDPRIPTVLGHFAGQASLALTLAPGPTLAEVVQAHRRGQVRLHAATVLDIVEDIAQTLRHAHSRLDSDGRPICHGHLSLRAVRIGPDGSIQVLGFGRMLPPESAGVLSPERLTEEPLSPASDQWALGALLIEMLTGRALYERGGGTADLASRLEGRVEPEIEPIARRHPGLGRLLSRMLAVRPEQRFADEGELIRTFQELRRSLTGVSDRQALAEAMASLSVADPTAPAPLAPLAPPPRPQPAPGTEAAFSRPVVIPTQVPLAEASGPTVAPSDHADDDHEVTEPVRLAPASGPSLDASTEVSEDEGPRAPRTGLSIVEKVAIALSLVFAVVAVVALLSSR